MMEEFADESPVQSPMIEEALEGDSSVEADEIEEAYSKGKLF